MATLKNEKIWLDKTYYQNAERDYYENLAKVQGSPALSSKSSLANEVAKAREYIKNSLECIGHALPEVENTALTSTISRVENMVKDLAIRLESIKDLVVSIESRVNVLESDKSGGAVPAAKLPAAAAPTPAVDSDDGVDLFGSDDEEENEEAARLREERLAAYNAKKSKKPVLIAKSNIILDIKPWDDETDMAAMESQVRQIATDGLLWGAAKLVPLAYGIKKLQISCVVEDDKVSIDWLSDEITKNEDLVQSVDIAAFNKV